MEEGERWENARIIVVKYPDLQQMNTQWNESPYFLNLQETKIGLKNPFVREIGGKITVID